MRTIRAALTVAIIGIGPALAQNPSASNTGSPVNPPTLRSGDAATQNPYVNPGAAGTQLGHPSTATPAGGNRNGTTGTSSASTSPPSYPLYQSSRTPISAETARNMIQAQGYTGVTGLHQVAGGAVWQGTAMRDGRQVNVGVDGNGTVTETR